MSDPIWLWVRLRMSTMWSAFRALKDKSYDLHEDARYEESSKVRSEMRAEADHLDQEAEELRKSMMSAQNDPKGKEESP
jgi:hypothetical protein